MARGMNKAMIIGLVGCEPELRRTSDDQPVAAFGVSTSRCWRTSTGEARMSSEWFHLVAWGKLAETARHLHKDHRVYAEGHLQTRAWDDVDGHRHFLTELVADRLIPLGDLSRASPPDETEAEETPLCLNRVTVIGNLGRDPEMRYTPGGQAVTSFTVAATRTWTAANGEKRDATEWFNVVSWGNLAEICNQYLTKGRRVYVEGELRTRSWEQSGGQKHFRTELVAGEMILLGPRPASDLNDEPPQ